MVRPIHVLSIAMNGLVNYQLEKRNASLLMQQGRVAEAHALLLSLCQNARHDAEAFYLLGSCAGMLGNYRQAIEALSKSAELQYDVPQTHYALGGAHRLLGEFREAEDCFRRVVEFRPGEEGGLIALGEVLALQGHKQEARDCFLRAQSLSPKPVSACLGLGRLAEQDDRYQDALRYFQQAVKYEPTSAPCLCAAAGAMITLGRWREAGGLFRKALRHAPGYPDALGGLARIHDRAGEYEKAYKQIEPLVKRGAYSTSAAMAFLGVCKHIGRCDEAVAYTEALLAHMTDLPPRPRANLHMAVGRTLDQLRRYDEAFRHFRAGNEAIRLNYDPVGHRLWVDSIMQVFNRDLMFRLPRANGNTRRPIFIIGMPRSGTSLMEQILASHPDVEGGGELTDLGDLMQRLQYEIGSSQPWPHCVTDMSKDDLDRFSRSYLDKLRSISKKARHVTDKMPQNYYVLGLIALLFPQSRVIHCQRDPLDTSLSIYFQSFYDGHAYARDLFNIGTHYHQYQRLMDHWRAVLTIPILDVRYESLVDDPHNVVREVLNFCGLEWNSDCLDFYQLKRKMDTASYDQVRQPLYSQSVQRWRRYEPYIAKLKEGLERGY